MTVNVHYLRMLQPQSLAGADCVTQFIHVILFLNEFFIVSCSFFVFAFVFALILAVMSPYLSVNYVPQKQELTVHLFAF